MSIPSVNFITQRVSQKMKKKGQTSPNDDPTEGDGRRWAQGSKYAFLVARLPRWEDARASSAISSFYGRVTLLFIRHFTWEHALDVDGTGPPGEPSEDNLDAVLDPTGLTPEELIERNGIYWEVRGKLQRWFRYHGTKSLKSNKPDSSLEKIIKAFGTQSKAPRRMQTLQFYSKLYYEARVKAIVDSEWAKLVAQAAYKGAPLPKRLKHQNAVVARVYASETPQFQNALKAQRDAEYDEEVAAWKASRLDFGSAPRSSKEYHEALVEASHWLPGFAEALSKHLGLNVAVMLTGPIPANEGRIEVKAIHAGKSRGLVPKIWPEHDPQTYTAVLKALVSFGRECFSEDECRRRAVANTMPEEDGDVTETTETSSRAPSPAPLPPVLAAVLDTAPLGKKDAAPQASIPGMPPPARMSSGRRFGDKPGAVPSTGTATAAVAGGKVCAPPMTIPSASTTTTSPPPAPSTATSRAPSSPASTTSSTSSLIVLPPPSATSQPPSLPPKGMTSATSRPQPRPKRKTPPCEGSSATASVVSSVAPASSPPTTAIPAAIETSRSATSPPRSTPEPSGTSLPPSSGIMSRVDIANCTPDIERLVGYLMKHGHWTPTWEHCVSTFVEIERYAEFQARGSLVSPTDGRPAEVAAWMKRARKLVDYPIDNVDQFAEAWLCWWGNNQPEGRHDDAEDGSSVDWSVLNVSGPNGIRLFLLTLAWWGHALEDDDSEERGAVWADALSDVKVVLDNVLLAAAALEDDEAANVDVEEEVSVTQARKRRRGTVSTSSSSVKKARKGGK